MIFGLSSKAMPGSAASSTSKSPQSAERPLARSVAAIIADATPLSRLAPARFWTMRCPASDSIAATSLAVVVFPLVPAMRIEPWLNPIARSEISRGARRNATNPGAEVPPPKSESPAGDAG